MILIEDHTMTVECRTSIKHCCFTLLMCMSVKWDSLSCSFTSTGISFLTNFLKIGFCVSISFCAEFIDD